MTDFTANRPLQNLGAGSARALGLKVLGAEAMGAFRRNLVIGGHAMTKMARQATSEQFPVIGRANVITHVPGTEIDGNVIQSAERTISLEDVKISPVFMPNIDRYLAHFDSRRPYADSISEALRVKMEEDVFFTGVQAARATSTIPGAEGHGDGAVLVDAAFDTDGVAIFNGIVRAAVAMKRKNVPKSDVIVALDPVRYSLLVQSEKPINKDVNPENGSLARGNVQYVNDLPIVESNSVVARDESANTEQPAVRRADFSNVRGLIWHRNSIGVLQAIDMELEDEYSARHQGTLLLGKMFYGMGILRPEAAAVLQTTGTEQGLSLN